MYISHLSLIQFSAETEQFFHCQVSFRAHNASYSSFCWGFFQLFKGISIPFSRGQSCDPKKGLSNNRKAVIVHTVSGKDMHELPELMKS